MLIILQNIARFVLLILVQVLILNNIQFLGYINPYIYILFILSLPARMPRWATLLLAFALGIAIDAFSNTLGLHAFAAVLMAYERYSVINLFTSLDEGNNPTPSFYTFGVSNYVKYVVTLVVIHHFTLFFLEAFSLHNAGLTLLKSVINSAITLLIIFGIQTLRKN